MRNVRFLLVREIFALSGKTYFLVMKLFHSLANAFFYLAENFTSFPTHFLLVRNFLRSAQRIFCLFEKFHALPSTFSAHAKNFISRSGVFSSNGMVPFIVRR